MSKKNGIKRRTFLTATNGSTVLVEESAPACEFTDALYNVYTGQAWRFALLEVWKGSLSRLLTGFAGLTALHLSAFVTGRRRQALSAFIGRERFGLYWFRNVNDTLTPTDWAENQKHGREHAVSRRRRLVSIRKLLNPRLVALSAFKGVLRSWKRARTFGLYKSAIINPNFVNDAIEIMRFTP